MSGILTVFVCVNKTKTIRLWRVFIDAVFY